MYGRELNFLIEGTLKYLLSQLPLHNFLSGHTTSFLSFLLFGRCSLLEPGPVGTALVGNMEAWHKKYDKPTADEESSKLLQAFIEKIWPVAEREMQDVKEVAEIVKTIILSEKPNLRYQTNEKWNPEEIKAKLADPTGNVMVELMTKKYFNKK